MKPSFALLLAQESVGLLHRTDSGWYSLGSAQFEDPDLIDSLGWLRGEAQDCASGPVASLLILPNSEVLYTSIARVEGRDPRDVIFEHLEARTPYQRDELVMDWRAEGDLLRVAAVARETLAEAESFATDYRFNPVAFQALPGVEQFPAMPWFGPSEGARSRGEEPEAEIALRLIARPEGAQPDAAPAAPAALQPLADIAPEPMPDTAPELPPEMPTEGDAEPLPDLLAAPEPEAGPEAPLPAVAEDEASAAPGEHPAEEPPAEHQAEAVAEQPPAPLAGDTTLDVAGLITAAPEEPQPAPLAETLPHPAPAEEPQAEPAPVTAYEAVAPQPQEAAVKAAVEATPAAQSAPEADPDPEPWPEAPAISPAARLLAEVAARPGPEHAPASLAARLAAAAAADAKARDAEEGAGAEAAPADSAPAETAFPDDLTESWPGESEADDTAQEPDHALEQSTRAALAASLNAAPDAARAAISARPVAAAPRGTAASIGAPSGLAAPKLPEKLQKAAGPRSRKSAKAAKAAPVLPPLPPSAARPPVKPAGSEAEAMTVYGARGPGRRVGGKPRYLGLALTGALLAILLGVAIWAAIYLETPAAQSNSHPEQGATLSLASAEEAATPAAPAGEDAAETGRLSTAAEPAAPEAGAPVTGRIEPGPAAGLTIDALTLPAADPLLPPQAESPALTARLSSSGAVPGESGDPAPAPAAALPAFGALFQFDDDGNILATRDGVITPDGVHLIIARPPLQPPARPAALTQPASEGTLAAPEQEIRADSPPTAAPGAASASAPPVNTAAAGGEALINAALLNTAAPPALPASALQTEPPAAAATLTEAEAAPATPRPRNRPEGLAAAPVAEPAPAATEEAATIEGPARRPAPRSARAAAAAEEAARAEESRRLAATAAAMAGSASILAALPPEAVPGLAATRRPAARPAGLSRVSIPAAALPVPAATPQRNAAPLRPTPGDDDDDGEPDTPRSAAPSIPTRASVARQATATDAIQLGRLNLLGVFGTNASRYALVREGNGRIRRVTVGDRLDGGRVTSIGQNTLNYQKSGTALRLEIPRG